MSVATLSPEDQARANLYGLLARLFYAPPDRELLRGLAAAEDLPAEDEDSQLASAWKAVKLAAGEADPEAVREEYEALFIGTGKAQVTLYATAYLGRGEDSGAAQHPLVKLRNFLAGCGLGRKGEAHEPEDHIAGLCEVMRHLVVEDDFAAQRNFFETFVGPSANRLCAAIAGSRRSCFYVHVARFAAAFFELEEQALKME